MSRRLAAAFLMVAVGIGAGLAQTPAGTPPLRFQWQPNQTLTYKVVQNTTVQETSLDESTQQPVTTEAKTNLLLVRKWTVKGVEPTGVATLEMTITEMKSEMRPPDGMPIVRDSANPEHAREMAEFLNKPIVTIRVD